MDRFGKSLRTAVANVLLLLGALAAGFAFAELVTRLLAPQPLTPAFISDAAEAALYRPDSALGFQLKPNLDAPYIFGTHLVTNSLGLRDREYGPKQPGEFRIMSLGDSYAMGFGVEEERSYDKLLEAELDHRHPGRVFSVITTGVPGYCTRQMLLTFERLHQRLQPDFVLATFVAGNDVYDNAVFEERLRTGLNTPVGFLGRHSHVARLVLRESFPAWFFAGNREEANIALTNQMLRELEDTLRASNLPFLMVVIPARHQIRPSAEPAALLLSKLGMNELIYRQNRAVIKDFQDDHVPFLDLLPILVASDREAPVSFASDSHLNARGHAVVAQAIFEKLEALLPPDLN